MGDTKEESKKYSGFTLIELLVVIAIIGLLTTISVIAFSRMRSQARDARRLADVKQIATALEMYYNDNGAYPDCYACSVEITFTHIEPAKDGWQKCLGAKLAPYMQMIPVDPINKDGSSYCYTSSYRASGNMISIIYYLENDNPNWGSALFYGRSMYGTYTYALVIQPYGGAFSSGY